MTIESEKKNSTVQKAKEERENDNKVKKEKMVMKMETGGIGARKRWPEENDDCKENGIRDVSDRGRRGTAPAGPTVINITRAIHEETLSLKLFDSVPDRYERERKRENPIPT